MTDRELMQQSLEKLEFFAHMKSVSEDTRRLIAVLRERLAQPESVKFNCTVVDDAHPEGVSLSQWHGLIRLDEAIAAVEEAEKRHTAPPKREWVGLTDEEIDEKTDFRGTVRYFEAKLKEKNQ